MKNLITAAYEAAAEKKAAEEKAAASKAAAEKTVLKVETNESSLLWSRKRRLYGDVFETMRKERMGQAVIVDSIAMTADKKGRISLAISQAKYGPNRETRMLERAGLVFGEERKCPVILLLTLNKGAVAKGGARAQFAAYHRNDDNGKLQWAYQLPGGDRWRDKFGKNVTRIIQDNPNVSCYGGVSKNVSTSSPGMVKKGQLMLRCINFDGYNPEHDLDQLTFGLYSQLQEHPTLAADASEVSKMSTRLGQFMAGSVDTTQIGTICIFAGKFKDESGDEYADGDLLIDSRYAAEVANVYLEESGSLLRFKRDAALGRGFQCRPWNCKTMGVVRSAEFINLFLEKQVDKKWQYICRRNVSPEQQEQFNMLFGRNKKNSAYYDKLVVIGDAPSFNGRIDVLTDLNGLKATFDLSRESGLNILQQSHDRVEEEKASDSTQLVPAFGGGLNSADDVSMIYTVEKRLARDEAAKIKESFDGSKQPSMLSLEDIPTAKDGRRIFRINSVLDKIAPAYKVRYDPGFYKSQAKECLESMTAHTRSFRHRFSGSYHKITVDPAHYLGFDVLHKKICEDNRGRIEIVTNNLVAADLWTTKDHLNGVVKRYPGAATNELALVRLVSVDEYCQRVDSLVEAGEISYNQSALAKKAVSAQAECGLCILPADSALLRKLGGADFDGDGVVVLAAVSMTAKIIVHQIEKSGSTEIRINDSVDKPIVDNVDLALDEAVCRRSLENYVSKGIPDVGEVISKHNLFKETTIRALTQSPEKVVKFWKDNVVEALLKQLEGSVIDKKAITSKFEHKKDVDGDVVDVDMKSVYRLCIRGAYASTVNEVLQCSKDFDYAARLFAEKSIDAAKKLFNLDCKYLDGLDVGLLGKGSEEDDFKIVVNWDKD